MTPTFPVRAQYSTGINVKEKSRRVDSEMSDRAHPTCHNESPNISGNFSYLAFLIPSDFGQT
jgi:hypothetical protein